LTRGSATSTAATSAPQPGAAPAAAPTLTGAQAYQVACAGCHGRTAAGGQGPPLAGSTRDINELLAIVREGRGQMPPLSPRDVTDDHVTLIAEYLRTLGTAGR
jgi:mono/diheme cytochrome c family protein